MNQLKFDKNGFLIPQKITFEVDQDEEIIDLIDNIKKQKGTRKKSEKK